MSAPAFSGPIPGLSRALEQTAARVRQSTTREAWYGLLWRWLALVSSYPVAALPSWRKRATWPRHSVPLPSVA